MVFMPTEIKIRKGDTLGEIAQTFGTTVSELAELNSIEDVDYIRAGDTLKLPKPKKAKEIDKKAKSIRKSIEEMPGIGLAALADPDDPRKLNPKILEIFERQNIDQKDRSKARRSKKIDSKTPIDTGTKPPATDKSLSRQSKDSEALLPINVRQFFNPEQDRTAADLSKAELDALKQVVDYSQRDDVRQAKIDRGINPNTIAYSDYNALGAGSLAQRNTKGNLIDKVTDPLTIMKSTLGRADIQTTDDGGYVVRDVFDFKPKTAETGLGKLTDYLGSIPSYGFNPYSQLRNYMGYYGPQEGTGAGGEFNIALASGGQIHNFNKGGSMNETQKQVKNIASKGRYGDTMLMHVNPMEVNAIAQQVPLTINPETGQPEAFLPFLAPIAGSLIGGSLLGGTALGALGASALGSGLAQYAVTGDLKKGLLAGLTGYGIGTALQGAGAAAQGAKASAAATDAATNIVNTDAINNALLDPNLTKLGVEYAPGEISGLLAGTSPEASAQLLNQAGLDSVAAANVGAQPAITAVGDQAAISGFGSEVGSAGYLADAPDSILQSGKDAFAGGFREGVGNLTTGLMKPAAYLPAGVGMGGTAMMESQEAFEQDLLDAKRKREEERAEMLRNTPEPILYSATGGLTQFDSGGDTDLPQIFAPDRTTYAVNPNFMPGFSPETMYFNPSTVSAPAAQLSPAGATAPSITDTYTGSKGGYGGLQASIAPQGVINPFESYTGTAPQGLAFQDTPIPMAMNTDSGMTPYTPPTSTTPNPAMMTKDEFRAKYEQEHGKPIKGGKAGGAAARAAYEKKFSEAYDDFRNSGVPVITTSPTIQYSNMPTTTPMSGFAPEQINQSVSMAPISPMPMYDIGPIDNSDYIDIGGFEAGFNQGGDTEKNLKPIPPDNKGLPKLPESVRNEMGYMQAGGDTDIAPEMQTDPLINEVTKFILGESDNNEVLNAFIAKYGNEAFMDLRQRVLESIVPGAQTEGLIAGEGNGGMDDDLRGMIGAKERIAVSQDEFIVPADVVSMLGDGSSDAGSKKLYEMMDRVRNEKTGKTEQAPMIDTQKVLPA